MLKKTVTYKNFDDEEVTEDLYFNLSKVELAKMELGKVGGMKAHLETIVKSEDVAAIVEAFDLILLKSVGKRVGGSFIKTQEVVDGFRYSGAYEVVFMELLTDANAASEFVAGVIPESLNEKANAVAVNLPTTPISVTPNLDTPAPDFTKMTSADFADWQRRQVSPLGL